ncbi:hypothetical protein [Zavarzinia compransoris]|uniref:hypothetical protein n=1 Tax=Zavarzinia compransoris TaxID=1264899 RepID=UPI00105FC793|nr:hypothetical protein [Zavarzinia compransoris]
MTDNKKASPNAPGDTTQVSQPATSTIVNSDAKPLIEQGRAAIVFGDWEAIQPADLALLEPNPGRARLAAIYAGAMANRGDFKSAREFCDRALQWGAEYELVATILLACAHDTLGRAAVFADDEALAEKHFANALALIAPGEANHLLLNARAASQIARARMQFATAGLPASGSSEETAKISRSIPEEILSNKSFFARSHAEYQRIGAKGGAERFLYLETKSLPRSGLHYTERGLRQIFADDFSFCEWYQEPGCCKKMPCALLGELEDVENGKKRLSLKMTKSHDFDLADPPYQLPLPVHRLVLIRNPLPILTSWFMLDLLAGHAELLSNNGIGINKIYFSHPASVVAAAYRIIAGAFNPPSPEELRKWIEEKSKYISGFVQKWCGENSRMKNTHLVSYENANQFIVKIASILEQRFDSQTRERLVAFARKSSEQFQPRSDPFRAPEPAISSYLRANARAFHEGAARIEENDSTGTFARLAASGLITSR